MFAQHTTTQIDASYSLSVHDLSVRLRHGNTTTQLLKPVDIQAYPGEMTVIAGPSGAGKSTLIRALTGTLPHDNEVHGSAFLLSERNTIDLLGLSERQRARVVRGRVVGAVGQDAPASFAPTRTIGASFLEVLRSIQPNERVSPGHPHIKTPNNRALCIQALLSVGLGEEFLDRYPHEMSGGQLTRANLARALVTHPPVLLADEPTAGLDPETAQSIALLLSTFARSGHCVVVVTHDLDSFGPVADYVVNIESTHPSLAELTSHTERSVARQTREHCRGALLDDITFSYDKPLFTGLNLNIHSGRVIGIEGPSGVGKSTLASIATLSRTPQSGHVVIDGNRIEGSGFDVPRETRRKIAWVPQSSSQAVDPRLTVAHILEHPARISGRMINVEEALAEVGLPAHTASKRARQLSGGELARVNLARSLALDPEILVIDEPTAMLDSATGNLMWKLITRAAHTRGTGVLVFSHDIAAMRDHVDEHYVMRATRGGTVLERKGPSQDTISALVDAIAVTGA